MTKYIDADLLRKEIEKNKNMIDGLFTEGDYSVYDGEDDAYNRVLRIIDSLQQDSILAEFMEKAIEIGKKYNYGFGPNLPQPKIDLEKEIDAIWNPRFNLGWDEHSCLTMNRNGFNDFARHFYELGLNARKEE